ncbi:MAG: response regulator [Muricoprocola sp.]
MYKVLVVDDEKMIRMGIKKAIDWESIGIDEVYTAATGKEALRIIEAYHPQIMITDIQMTEMTGLELIEVSRQRVPELRIIVLTGFDNFEYARQSLRMQVQDFFLKPIDEEDLTRAIEKQVQYLEKQISEEKKQQVFIRAEGSVQQTKLEDCIRDLIHNTREKQEILDALEKEFFLDIQQKMEVILIVPRLSMEHKEDQELQTIGVKNICMSMIDAQAKGITFYDRNDVIAIAYFEQGEEESALETVEELSDILRDEFDSKPKIIVGSTVNGFENLSISYNDAQYLLKNEKENIHDIIQTLQARNKGEIMRDIYAELKGIMCANVGNTAYVMKAFDTFAKAVVSYNLSTMTVRRYCFEIASALYFSYMEDAGEVAEGKLDALAHSLMSAKRDEACEITRMYIDRLLGKEEENVHHIITEAKHYIEEHLTEELSVSSIAASLYITPNYFSRLFKRVTKEGCNEYIVRKRIEKAKSLLQTTSLKTGKIAMMVGYRDTNYFSLAFKKQTGKSPTKYREEMQQMAEKK